MLVTNTLIYLSRTPSEEPVNWHQTDHCLGTIIDEVESRFETSKQQVIASLLVHYQK